MKFEQDFKDAIRDLYDKEKDKLLLRLLKKDEILAKQLYFDLVSAQTIEDRREEMAELVKQKVARMSRNFHSIGYLLMDVRYLSGEITEHVKVTKDKTGEISLNLLMLQEVLEQNNASILRQRKPKTDKFSLYVVVRTFKLLVLIKTLHEDLQFDFRDDLETLGQLFAQNDYLMQTAIYHGLNVNWLFNAEIPDDVKLIQDGLKKQGFLK